MRPRSRFSIAAVVAAATAVPAASASAGPASTLVLGDAERREATSRPGAAGPFDPTVGSADYGSADAAFGAARSGHVHAGQDIFAPAGTAIVAVAGGVVVEAGSDGGRGNFVAVFDPRRDRTYVYFHMLEPATQSAGERVSAGEPIGGVGCTGSCWGDHLHFELREGRDPYGEAVDPLPLLREWRSLPRPR